jgi:hypothetical protein
MASLTVDSPGSLLVTMFESDKRRTPQRSKPARQSKQIRRWLNELERRPCLSSEAIHGRMATSGRSTGNRGTRGYTNIKTGTTSGGRSRASAMLLTDFQPGS